MFSPSLDPIFLMFAVAVFVAVVLGFEGLYLWWNSSRGPEARRMERRLRAMSAGSHSEEQVSLLKRRSRRVERLVEGVPLPIVYDGEPSREFLEKERLGELVLQADG